MNGLQKAIDKAGSQSALARMIGTTQQNVHHWVKRSWVPAEVVKSIEAATGVPRHELRPDLWEPSSKAD